jgi:hypothetical protein
MVDNMQDYNIYAAGQSRKEPWAIVFHPKNTNKRLDGSDDRWFKVEDKKELETLISWLEVRPGFPRLLSILGPDDAFYASIYTLARQVRTKVLDENTIFVFDIDPYSFMNK